MPRSNRPRRSGRPGSGRLQTPERGPVTSAGLQRTESHADGEWVVRRVTGAASGRDYLCPGCSQRIPPGAPHVVAWPAQGLTGDEAALEQRRHWHSPCWHRRTTRRPR